jgi:mRNA-degrading endonuclease RelE of RelBE toxin-antitoxin system
MRKKIEWKDAAKRNLRAIDRATALDILHKIDRFALTSEGDVKQLQGIDPPVFRLRVGDYRVRFHDVDDTITILTVKHRSDAYR